MTELIEAVNAVVPKDSDVKEISLRVVFPGKKDPTFTGNLLTGVSVISSSKELEGKVGTLFIRTKDCSTYENCASWFNSFANKNVGNLIKRYENIITKIDNHHKSCEILFRPSGTILEPTEWVFYYISESRFNKSIPSCNIEYILCCGGDEKLIQGAPTSFAVFNRD
jgi:hypothetical protein